MDTRNVQRTGDMFYLYLPTRWCKRFNITGKSKVGVALNNDGSLGIYPAAVKREPIHLNFKVKDESIESIHKLIVACYISPADTFKITLDKDIDFTKVLDQKNLVSLELVEIDGNQITCESSLQVSDPLALLTTMIRKVKNLLLVLSRGAHSGLVERYEEEIDRSKLLIEKAVIQSLVNPGQSNQTGIDLHFISLISKELERIVDRLILLDNVHTGFIDNVSGALGELQKLLGGEKVSALTYQGALAFLSAVNKFTDQKVKDVQTYNLQLIIGSLQNISEVVMDWAVLMETEKMSKSI